MTNLARKPINSIPPEEFAALPRTTRWRAEKRGWVAVNYHQRLANVRVLASPQFESESQNIYKQAGKLVALCLRGNWAFPAHYDRQDLIQECVIELWRCSAKAGFESSQWRSEVIFRHLRRLRGQTRFDRDLFKRVEEL